MKNGLKLGSSNLPNSNKNSFAFENEFIDYQDDINDSEEDVDRSEDLDYSENTNNNKDNNKSNHYSPINSLPEQSKVHKKKNEDKRLQHLSSQMGQLSVSLLEMKQKYKDLDMEEVLFRKRDIKKEEQVKKFIRQKKREKRRLQQKMSRIKQKQEKKLQQSLIISQQQKLSLIKNRRQEQLSKIRQRKEQKQIQKQKKMQEDQRIEEMYRQIRQKEKVQKKFHIRKQIQDKKRMKEEKQKQKIFLSKRKENYKPLDLQQLEQHERRNREIVERLNAEKRARKEEHYRQILQKNQSLEKLYRGNCYQYVQDEIQELKHKKQQPHQKQKKMKNYQQYVRQNFIPKTHQNHNKSADIQRKTNASSLSHREVKRYRYFQGVSFGQIVENRPVAKSQAEQRKIGNGYMVYMKGLPKKKAKQPQEQYSEGDIQLLKNRLNSIVKVQKDKNPLYERSGRKSLEVKISEKPTRDELNMVINQLKNKDKQTKMHEKVIDYENHNSYDKHEKNKQINQQIIENIERKLNLLTKL